jgi:hypothetical protein
MDQKGQLSPDGKWFWNGQTWLSALSADGHWRWDGTNWAATRPVSVRKRWDAGIAWLPGLRTGVAWKLPVIALGFLLMLAGINSAVSQPPTGSAGPPIAQTLQTPSVAAATPSPSSSAKPSPSTSPSPSPTHSPTPVAAPAAVPPPAPPPPPQNTCGAPPNPWGYNFCSGNVIYSPPSNFCSYFDCISSFWKSTNGYVDECADGMYSHSGGRQGACSYHGGELKKLYS